MTLQPDVRNFLEDVAPLYPAPRWEELDAAGAAHYLHRARQPRPKGGPEDPELAAVPTWDTATSEGIPLRVYGRPAANAAPLIVYLHGGGWVMGDLELNDPMCRRLASHCELVVVSASYRLAPEHPFPAPLNDCYAALCWTHEHAAQLAGDPQQLTVMGTSAGGNLAAAAALMARSRGGPPIACQALVYPVLDDSLRSASYDENATGYFLEREQMRWYWDQYVPDPADRLSPYAVPARARDLSGLPPAVMVTAEYDPLRDEGEMFANRLRAAAVPVDYRCYKGQIHGFLGLDDVIAEAKAATVALGEAVRRMLQKASRAR
jgi:acetyl esterase